MAGKDPKGRRLEGAIEHIASRVVSDLSLRELAAAIGTSHRMLIHHFGGREGLWVEVIRTV
jgi:AcrR family transcriptional regulator